MQFSGIAGLRRQNLIDRDVYAIENFVGIILIVIIVIVFLLLGPVAIFGPESLYFTIGGVAVVGVIVVGFLYVRSYEQPFSTVSPPSQLLPSYLYGHSHHHHMPNHRRSSSR